MRFRFHPWLFAFAALTLPLLTPSVRAAVPEGTPPRASVATPDTGQFLPPWLHLHASAGIGWLSAPETIRRRYEAGQVFEAGLEARMRPNLRVRLNAEYMSMPAVGEVRYQFVALAPLDNQPVVDTLSFDWRRSGWVGSLRSELQWRALPHTWLIAGAGRGYLNAGLRPYHFRDPFITVDMEFPGSDGWAWTSMLGARYDFDVFGPILGLEARWSLLDRPQDELQTWSVRVGWQGR